MLRSDTDIHVYQLNVTNLDFIWKRNVHLLINKSRRLCHGILWSNKLKPVPVPVHTEQVNGLLPPINYFSFSFLTSGNFFLTPCILDNSADLVVVYILSYFHRKKTRNNKVKYNTGLGKKYLIRSYDVKGVALTATKFICKKLWDRWLLFSPG